MSSSSSVSSSASSGSSSGVSSSVSSSASGDHTRGIRLRRLVQQRYKINVIDGFRFRVEAYGAHLMPNAIFRYIRRPLNPDDGTKTDEFDGVCSPPDLEEFGEGAPIPGAAPPFLRLDYVDLVFRSQHEAEEAWQVIREEVASLFETLNTMDTLVPAEDVVFGNPAPT